MCGCGWARLAERPGCKKGPSSLVMRCEGGRVGLVVSQVTGCSDNGHSVVGVGLLAVAYERLGT